MTNPRTDNSQGANDPESEKGADLGRLLHQSRILQEHRRERIRYVVLLLQVIGDALAFTVAQVMAAYVTIDSGWSHSLAPSEQFSTFSYLPHFLFGLISFLILAGVENVYQEERCLRLAGLLTKLVKIAVYWSLIYLFISPIFRLTPEVSRLYVFMAAVFSVPMLFLGRYALLKAVMRTKWIADLQQKVILVGTGKELQDLVRSVSRDPRHPYRILGWLETAETRAKGNTLNVKCLGDYEDIEEVIMHRRPDILILEDVGVGVKAIDRLINLCGREQVDFKVAGSFYRVFVTALRIQMIGGVPVLGVQRLAAKTWYNRFVKRILDIVGAIVGLTILSPVMLFFMWRVHRESPGPMIYRKARAGLRSEEFNILKIRSMKLGADKEGYWSTKDDPRRLKVGEFMRKWNIDELPQFWNVLKGEMSLVGPRPETTELVEDFKHDIRLYNMRHAVKPGMTGWAQIHGLRGDTSLNDRIRHDLYYIENWSLWMDFFIMFRTLVSNKNAA